MRLLKFSIENYKSYKEKQEVLFCENEKNTTAFFGPNSSGKSNFFSALNFFCDFILHSTDFHRTKVLANDFFRLSDDGKKRETSFCAEFKNQNYQYEYCFSITRDGNVADERLRRKKTDSSNNYKTVFSRGSIINNRYNNYDFTPRLLNETRSDSLVLTRAYSANNSIAKDVFSCIESIMLISGSKINVKYTGYTAEMVSERPERKSEVLRFLKLADLYIQDFSVEKDDRIEKMDSSMFSPAMTEMLRRASYKVATSHALRDNNGNVIGLTNMSMYEDESAGTNQLFEYASLILEALKEGKILYIDELEINLHPRECAFIVNLFNDNYKENTANGQLIINTHETNLIDLLGKDNCYFLGKDKFESTIIKKLSGIRSDEKNLAKKYNAGLYGAVPQIGL